MKRSSVNTLVSDVRAAALCALLAAAASAGAGESQPPTGRQPYERYASIVERQMFGPLPANFDPTKSPADVARTSSKEEQELTKEQEKVKSAISFTIINVTPEGETEIGFTDKSEPNKPMHYYLKVGESRNGWLVKEADAKTASMTIEKDGIEVSLTLGGDSSKDAGKTDSAQPAVASASGGRSKILDRPMTLSSRRKQREEKAAAALRKTQEEMQARQKELDAEREAREQEREAQRQAEREEHKATLEQLKAVLQQQRDSAKNRQNGESGGEGGGENQ